MKIYDYYKDSANITLNGGIASLVPAIFIIVVNLLFLKQRMIMAFCLPFLAYSFFCYQLYYYKTKDSLLILKNMGPEQIPYKSMFSSKQLLVFYLPTYTPRLLLFFPDGNKAGEIRNSTSKKEVLMGFITLRKTPKRYTLYDENQNPSGFYLIKKNKNINIEVYNDKEEFLGNFQKGKQYGNLLDTEGSCWGKTVGSRLYMDEKILSPQDNELVRLRRGWMPLEWSKLFPEPNTPIISLNPELSNEKKLMGMSLLIQEFFIER